MAQRILGIIGWIGVGLVLASLAIRFGMPARDQYAYYLAWAGLVCLLAYTLSQWREIVTAFSGRNARYGTLTAVSVLVVLAILVAINYIGRRQNKRWDTTAAQQFAISDQSRNVVSKLDAPLQVTVFARESDFPRWRDRVKEYEYVSGQVKAEYVDPERQPLVAQQHQIDRMGTVVINYKGRTERVTSDTEQDITNGIIKVVTGQQKKVYFTQGHGEKDIAAADARDGYSGVAEALKGDNYTAETLVLAQTGSVPPDAAAVVVAGPQNDFFPPEVDALKKYLGANGKLMLMLDPPSQPTASPLPNLVALAQEYGVTVGNDIVLDVSGMGQLFGASEAMPVAANYPPHAITERFRLMTVYPLTRSVTPVQGGTEGRIAQSIIETSPRSWAETDLKGLLSQSPAELDESNGDKPGPITIAAAVSVPSTAEPPKPETPDTAETSKPEARLLVFGDSDFASNNVLSAAGNRDLFMNSLGWVSQQENLISIRPKEAQDRRVTMTAAQVTNVIWLSMLLIPGAVFGTGIYNWWRRR